MRIIIVGCGKLGYTISKILSENGNDVYVIDKKMDYFDKIVDSIDVMVLNGNGLSFEVLEEASISTADIIISVAGSDETNILCCILGKKLGAKYSIARVRDPEYAKEVNKMRKDLGLDLIINPEQDAALDISRLLRYPSSSEIETFVNGRVEMVSYKIRGNDILVGNSIKRAFSRKSIQVLVVSVQRGEEIFIPSGDFVLQKDDIINILGRPLYITDFFKFIGINIIKIQNVMIIGGGKITYYLAEYLTRYKIEVKIIEKDEKISTLLSEDLTDCTIINGDGSDEEVLLSENFDVSGAVICLTGRDEENIVMGMYAKKYNIPNIIIKVTHINVNMVKSLKVGEVISPIVSSAKQIIRYVGGLKNSIARNNVHAMYQITGSDDNYIEALEFEVNESSKCLNICLDNLKLQKNILIAFIVRGGNIIIPTGKSVIKARDTVTIISKGEYISEFDEILEGTSLKNGGESDEL